MQKDYSTILLEEIRDEARAVHELVADVPTRGEFNQLGQEVDKLSDDMEAVKVTEALRPLAGSLTNAISAQQ